MSNLNHPDNAPLQELAPPAVHLPIIAFRFADYAGSPEDARKLARELAVHLSAAARAFLAERPAEKVRIPVTLQ